MKEEDEELPENPEEASEEKQEEEIDLHHEAKKHDSLMRQLKSARGEVQVSHLVELQPENGDKKKCYDRLEQLFADGYLNCHTEDLQMESMITLSTEGNEFLYRGGYSRLRRKMICEATEQTKEPIWQYIVPILLFVLLLAALYFVLPLVWKI